MIYFKVDVGYFPATNVNDNVTNLSDIVFTDTDKYYSIMTNYDGQFPNSTKTIEEFAAACQEHFGDDWLNIWNTPSRESTFYLTLSTQWLPSNRYMYPNLWDFRYSAEYSQVPYFKVAIYFKNLGKLLCWNIYDVDSETGTLTFVRGWSDPGIGVEQGIEYPLLADGYVEGETDLSTAMFSHLSATTNTEGGRPSSVSIRTSGLVGLNYIFVNNPTPDVGPTPPLPDTDDPYEPGGFSEGGIGGTGTFSDTGDLIGIPALPTLSAVDTGLITLFNPTAAQVKSLANYLWSSGFDLTTFKNIVANPMDCILGLTIIPATPTSTANKNLVVGNIDTGLSFPALDTQYIEIDCGTLNVEEFWGCYLDYSPYTKMSLYLPYIGIVPVDIDDVMNASVHVVYHMDVLSGALVAYVQCNETQLYTYIGQCSSNVPVTSNDFTNTVNGILGIAGNIGSLFATGGASAPTAISGMASNAINALKPNIQKSGAMSGTGGLMGVQTPYLICSRPRQSLPQNQNSYTGYPSNITATLGTLSGYTEIEKIHLDGITCTSEEMDELLTLLENGVII